ncbi:MAG: restriction endonuclease subunit S [Bacteroidales bacterium]|nr:restriction endonuclease subunit S [Candidatus Physcocola equi]
MSKIDDLIKELCPNGVEWKKLGEVCTIQRGVRVVKSQLKTNGKYPVFQNSLAPMGYFDDYNRSACTTYLISAGTAGEVGFCDTNYWSADDCLCFLDCCGVKDKFLYYILKSKQTILYSNVRKASIPRLSKDIVAKIIIPLPPLPIQEEIVRILDKFVEQQEQLEQLIELRKKQYEYYREELLTPKEGEEWETKTLGEIGTFVRGNGLQKTDFTEEGIGCIHYGQIYTHYGMFTDKTKSFVSEELAKKLKKVDTSDIVLACTSENIEDVCKCVVWEGSDTIVIGGHSSIYKHNENPRFIAYFLKSKAFEVQKIKYAYGAKVIDIKNDDLEKVIIKLPSLDKQNKIVESLNNFESSITDLTSALEASKARYAHYRDQLLKF